MQKAFEPYCDLWKRVDDWMSWHKGWMNDSFLSLDPEEVPSYRIILREDRCSTYGTDFVWLFDAFCCISSVGSFLSIVARFAFYSRR